MCLLAQERMAVVCVKSNSIAHSLLHTSVIWIELYMYVYDNMYNNYYDYISYMCTCMHTSDFLLLLTLVCLPKEFPIFKKKSNIQYMVFLIILKAFSHLMWMKVN